MVNKIVIKINNHLKVKSTNKITFTSKTLGLHFNKTYLKVEIIITTTNSVIIIVIAMHLQKLILKTIIITIVNKIVINNHKISLQTIIIKITIIRIIIIAIKL